MHWHAIHRLKICNNTDSLLQETEKELALAKAYNQATDQALTATRRQLELSQQADQVLTDQLQAERQMTAARLKAKRRSKAWAIGAGAGALAAAAFGAPVFVVAAIAMIPAARELRRPK